MSAFKKMDWVRKIGRNKIFRVVEIGSLPGLTVYRVLDCRMQSTYTIKPLMELVKPSILDRIKYFAGVE